MKLAVQFGAEKLASACNFQVVALIKEMAKQEGIYGEYFEYIDENGVTRSNKKPKHYCFGIVPGQVNYSTFLPQKNSKLVFKDTFVELPEKMFTVVFSSPDIEFLKKMRKFINENPQLVKQLTGWQLLKTPGMPVKEPEIKENSIVIRTITPIIVKKHDRTVEKLSLKNDPARVNESLNYIMNEVFKYNFGRELNPIELEWINGKTKEGLVRIWLDSNTCYKVFGIWGEVKLKGDPEDLTMILQTGLGFRRSHGFGLITKVPEVAVRKNIKKARKVKK